MKNDTHNALASLSILTIFKINNNPHNENKNTTQWRDRNFMVDSCLMRSMYDYVRTYSSTLRNLRVREPKNRFIQCLFCLVPIEINCFSWKQKGRIWIEKLAEKIAAKTSMRCFWLKFLMTFAKTYTFRCQPNVNGATSLIFFRILCTLFYAPNWEYIYILNILLHAWQCVEKGRK